MSGSERSVAPGRRGHQGRRSVSRHGDAAEIEADRAARVVAGGGRVSNWSFSAVPTAETVHREEAQKGGPAKASKDDKKEVEEAVTKTGEALLETKAGKKVKEELLALPPVKAAKDFAGTTGGKVAIGAGLVGGVSALAATGKELPVQPPAIPLSLINPKLEGFSAKVTWKGPVNAPTEGGIVISFSPKGPSTKGSKQKDFAAETARLQEADRRFKEGLKSSQQRSDEDFAMQYMVLQQMAKRSTFVPFDPGKVAEPPAVYGPQLPPDAGAGSEKDAEQQPKKDDDAPVQREAANGVVSSTLDGEQVQGHVDDALIDGGRPLDRSTRTFMEARFGVDFSGVRIHDDSRASRAASGLEASAFTVGEHVVFAGGRFDPDGPTGRHLLAHELAHVVQQSRVEPGAMPLQRLGAGNWIGVFLGVSEGKWSDEELTDYLGLVTSTKSIEGKFHSDNKARAIVRRWTTADAAFDLTAAQKVLLIQEMLDGPTLAADEEAIVDLLTLSPAAHLPDLIGPKGVPLDRVEADIDGEVQQSRLQGWLAVSFVGGRDAVKAGKVVVAGKDPEKGYQDLQKGVTEANAPLRAQIPKEVVDAMAAAWKKSFPKGKSMERGGLWVQHKNGKREWIPATKTTSGTTTIPYDKVPKGSKILVVGHTHPYDESEGGHLGVVFSGGDFSSMVWESGPVEVVAAGTRLYALVRTPTFDAFVAKAKSKADLAERIENEFDATVKEASGSFAEKVHAAARATCRKYGLVLYEGTAAGEVLKVDVSR